MDALQRYYREVWAVDFEFTAPPGERPHPLCVAARELLSGRLHTAWLEDTAPAPWWSRGPDTLTVAYYASAEMTCHLALGWPFPSRLLDLYAEFRALTCGRTVPCGHGLLGALAYFRPRRVGSRRQRGPAPTRAAGWALYGRPNAGPPHLLSDRRGRAGPLAARRCSRTSTCPARSSEDATCRLQPGWNGPASPVTWQPCTSSARSGTCSVTG